MPPKCKADSEDAGSNMKKSKPSAPRLKKSQRGEWESHWSKEKPGGEWAQKCIERWCLLPPYDAEFTEKHWKNYYQERSALDAVNTMSSEASKPIVSEELGQDTFAILRRVSANVANILYGAVCDDKDERNAIARTIRGSLYHTNLWGNDEEGGGNNPRAVKAKTRIYSPFGLSPSLDMVYDYHYRTYKRVERSSILYVHARSMGGCNVKEPLKNVAVTRDKNGRQKPEYGTIKVINMVDGAKATGTTAKNLEELEEGLFGGCGWLSPLKVFQLVAHAGTVGHYHEALRASLLNKGGLSKFKLFKDETDGKEMGTAEAKALTDIEAKLGNDGEICIPQRLLLLAKGNEQK
ncbi:hypothetical protein GYMLUDRAFT_245148 [Collybiopsis luxurians FD-317 M1]|uniref:Uncharacterized protein n=1 Tax=Collybiopsis luxurians FD-317 M1 TaxID=944289 RepID=A0A0D0CLM4_9AGAR|nr:hypothetical protein GYMLUDRAFT_245148 [Collybiopsis luxurians FD-317 M1]